MINPKPQFSDSFCLSEGNLIFRISPNERKQFRNSSKDVNTGIPPTNILVEKGFWFSKFAFILFLALVSLSFSLNFFVFQVMRSRNDLDYRFIFKEWNKAIQTIVCLLSNNFQEFLDRRLHRIGKSNPQTSFGCLLG